MHILLFHNYSGTSYDFLNNQFSEQETTCALNITVSQSIIFKGELVNV